MAACPPLPNAPPDEMPAIGEPPPLAIEDTGVPPNPPPYPAASVPPADCGTTGAPGPPPIPSDAADASGPPPAASGSVDEAGSASEAASSTSPTTSPSAAIVFGAPPMPLESIGAWREPSASLELRHLPPECLSPSSVRSTPPFSQQAARHQQRSPHRDTPTVSFMMTRRLPEPQGRPAVRLRRAGARLSFTAALMALSGCDGRTHHEFTGSSLNEGTGMASHVSGAVLIGRCQ